MAFVDMLDAAGPATDENQPGRVEQHDADTGAVRQVLVTRHSVSASCGRQSQGLPPRSPHQGSPQDAGYSGLQLDFDFSIVVVNGTSITPRASSALIQALIRSIEI